jgi:hypothetical protein
MKATRGVARHTSKHTFYASPCSAASRWWRIALAPGFVEPLCRIASLPHARSPGPRGFSLSLSNTHPNTHWGWRMWAAGSQQTRARSEHKRRFVLGCRFAPVRQGQGRWCRPSDPMGLDVTGTDLT